MQCLLCSHPAMAGETQTFDCPHCGLKFKDQNFLISAAEEMIRYSLHKNNSEDEGYKNFLNKLVIPLKEFLPQTKFAHLDFGCGPAPTISLLLQGTKAESSDYDPQFFQRKDLLVSGHYDVVTSTEVVEHFRDPATDWNLIVELVKPDGLIAIMTQILKDETNYKDWWYKNDPTHVVFYREKTIAYICRKYKLDLLYYDQKSVMIFRKLAE